MSAPEMIVGSEVSGTGTGISNRKKPANKKGAGGGKKGTKALAQSFLKKAVSDGYINDVLWKKDYDITKRHEMEEFLEQSIIEQLEDRKLDIVEDEIAIYNMLLRARVLHLAFDLHKIIGDETEKDHQLRLKEIKELAARNDDILDVGSSPGVPFNIDNNNSFSNRNLVPFTSPSPVLGTRAFSNRDLSSTKSSNSSRKNVTSIIKANQTGTRHHSPLLVNSDQKQLLGSPPASLGRRMLSGLTAVGDDENVQQILARAEDVSCIWYMLVSLLVYLNK